VFSTVCALHIEGWKQCAKLQWKLCFGGSVHYTTVHYTTIHYSTLQYTTLHYSTLQYSTLHYSTLHYTTVHYTTLYYSTLHYTILQYASNSNFAVWNRTGWCCSERLTQDCHYTTQYPGGKQYSRWNMEQFHPYYHVQYANWLNGELNTADTYCRVGGHNMGNNSDKGLTKVHKGLLS
jgi:hypothetical protein